MGIEIDFSWKIAKQWKLEGVGSFGDWIWNSKGIQTKPDGTVIEFDPTGVHVGDAAQTQIGGGIRFEPRRGMYVSTRSYFFGKNYSNFDPESLQNANARRESWKQPDYFLSDVHFGYQIRKRNEPTVDIRLSILNVFNTRYISDARNNDTLGSATATSNFDASSATVFYGQGRRWTVSLEVSF